MVVVVVDMVGQTSRTDPKVGPVVLVVATESTTQILTAALVMQQHYKHPMEQHTTSLPSTETLVVASAMQPRQVQVEVELVPPERQQPHSE